MSDNLYAPPQADLGAHAAPVLGTGDFDLARCFSEAWARTWENFPLWLGTGIVLLLAMTASVVTVIGIFLLVPILSWGGFLFTLRMHDGGASIGDLFAGFSRYGRVLGPMLGIFFLNLALGVPANVVIQLGANQQPLNFSLVGAGYALSIAIALFVTSRLSFVPLLMVDRDMRLGAALSEAWARTAELKGKVALLVVANILVAVAGLIAFCIGIIPATVIGFLMWVSAYRQIFGGAPQPAA
jgi:hypothetical protein